MNLDKLSKLYMNLEKFNFNNPEDIKRLKEEYDSKNKLDGEEFGKLFTTFGIELDEREASFELENNSKVDVEIYPEKTRAKRHALQEKFREVLFDSYINKINERESIKNQFKPEIKQYEKNQAELDKTNLILNNRDFAYFFADFELDENKTIRGASLADFLRDPNKKAEEKNEMIEKQIDNLMEKINELHEPSSDEEFVKNYSDIYKFTSIFMYDGLAGAFEKFAGCELTPELKDKFVGYREHANGFGKVDAKRITIIANPGYEFMSNDDLEKLAVFCGENDIFERTVGSDIDPLFDVKSYASEKPDVQKEPLKSFIALKVINKNDTLYGEKGPIDNNEATKLVQQNKLIGVKDKEGNLKVVGYDKQNNIVSVDIQKDFDKKAACQRMYDTLEKGTGIFIKSSPEYKNMRNILAKMAKGEGNDIENIKDLKENAKKYLHNHDFKTTTAGTTANKRKACVESMLEQLAEVEPNIVYGDNLKQLAANKEVNHISMESRLLNDENKISNSDRAYINEGDKKVISSANEMGADIQINQEKVGS